MVQLHVHIIDILMKMSVTLSQMPIWPTKHDTGNFLDLQLSSLLRHSVLMVGTYLVKQLYGIVAVRFILYTEEVLAHLLACLSGSDLKCPVPDTAKTKGRYHEHRKNLYQVVPSSGWRNASFGQLNHQSQQSQNFQSRRPVLHTGRRMPWHHLPAIWWDPRLHGEPDRSGDHPLPYPAGWNMRA